MPARNNSGRLTANQQLNYTPCIFNYAMAADSTASPIAFVAPENMEIVDIIVQARATSNAAVVSIINAGTAGSETDAICTDIACAADGAVTRVSAGMDDTKSIIPKGTVIKVDASAADVRGLVTFIGYFR